ncbi:MAG: OmpA family protein [Chitinophagaceae bacterium]
MSFNLLDSVKGILGNDLISNAAALFGENATNTQKAMSGIVPSVLAGILNKAGSGDVGGIYNLAKSAADSGLAANMNGLLANTTLLSKGADMLKAVFGNKMSDVTNTIASFAGIKSTSAASLLSIAAPAALGALGDHAKSTNMSMNGMLSFLNTQKESIQGALPAGLDLAGALGLSNIGNIGSKLTGVAGGLKQTSEKQSGSKKWLIPVIIVGLIALAWFILRKPTAADPVQIAPVAADTVKAALPSAAAIKVKLPDGIELNAYKGGIEDQLVSFLANDAEKADKNTWFDFDNLNFESGNAIITPESEQQLGNLSAILKAFPNAVLKIGGYTDKTGDSIANLKLSQARAEEVLNTLKKSGTNAMQLESAEGYGSQFAKAPTDASDMEKQKDRRIAVSVRKK